ncbi:MAG: thiamine pyrophosphate-binding protein [Vicinamibacterales bacterium]
MTNPVTGGDALAAQLVREGVSHVFGVPGLQLDHAIDGLARLDGGLAFHTTRHEQGAAYMADGYARVTGRPGVCLVVPGPGVLNTMAALSTAWACSSPVVCLAGQIPLSAIGRHLGLLHDIPDQSGALATVTKWRGMATRADDIPSLVREAFRAATSDRPRPVALELPPDVLAAPVSESAPIGCSSSVKRETPPAADVARAAALLSQARQPLIYAGGGVIAGSAWRELRALAERLQAPVVMSENGRGAVSDRHPLALVSLGGRALLPHADVVLVVGSRFLNGMGEPVGRAAQATFIHLNVDPVDLGPPRRIDVALAGDAASGLVALLDALPESCRPTSPAVNLDRVRAWCGAQIDAVEPQRSWVRALRAAVPDDGVLVTELTQVSYLAQVAFPVYEPRAYITPGYQGTLGYGFATALGAAAGVPGRAVVCLTGDGGFGWTLSELATARKYGWPLVTVVFSDGAYGNVKRTQRLRFGGRVFGSELENPDFVRLASAFGVDAARAATPGELEGVLREAIGGRRPAVIEVPVGDMPSAWHLLHDFVPPPVPPPPSPLDEPPGAE